MVVFNSCLYFFLRRPPSVALAIPAFIFFLRRPRHHFVYFFLSPSGSVATPAKLGLKKGKINAGVA